MAIYIGTNTPSLNAQRSLAGTQRTLEGNLRRLSTGMRINSAADDAAGLAISERLKAQIRSLAQAERNANDGVSLLQTAEGALNEISGILTRMRELAVQAANGTLTSTERGYLDDEFTELSEEIDRIADVTEFNGIMLLDGTTSSIDFQVGIHSGDANVLEVTMEDVHVSNLAGLGSASLGDASAAQAALEEIDDAIDEISSARAHVGAMQNRMTITINNLSSARENLSAANSRIRDVDVAEETAALTRNSILMQAGVSVLAQANQMPAMALSLLG